MIWLSLHPSPAGETSAFNKTRAFKSRRAGLFPFRIKPSSRSCSSALSRTTYLFTDFSRVAIVPSVARSVTEANHQILSNWLKRATSLIPSVSGAEMTFYRHPGGGWVFLVGSIAFGGSIPDDPRIRQILENVLNE